MRPTRLGIALAATLLTAGCIVPLVGPDGNAGPTPEQSRAELLSRPDIETSTADLELMLDDIQTALTAGTGLPATWESSRNEAWDVVAYVRAWASGRSTCSSTPRSVVTKETVLDLLPALRAGGGVVWWPTNPRASRSPTTASCLVAVDKDGLDAAPGESVLLRLGHLPEQGP